MKFRVTEFAQAAKWFGQHLDTLGGRSADPALPQRWRRHAEVVAADVGELAIDLGMSDRERELAALMGLLHGVGGLVLPEERGQTPNDEASGFALLDGSGCLAGLSLDELPLVEAVVRYHDRASLPGFFSPRALFFCQLVRDANQLDEWSTALAELARHPVCGELRREAITELLCGRLPTAPEPACREDLALVQLGRVFRFHFALSLRRVLGRELIERTCAELGHEPAMAVVLEHLRTYAHNRIAADSVTPRRP